MKNEAVASSRVRVLTKDFMCEVLQLMKDFVFGGAKSPLFF